MSFKTETIKKVVSNLKDAEKAYMNISVDDIKMCISDGNQKIGRVMNVSLPPVLTCGNCKECMHYCYDIKACLQYSNTVIDARIRNLVILKKDRNEYFDRIEKKVSRRRKNKYFRWHVAGDIIDLDYFERMVKIAVDHPDFVFWTYTKMYHIVNEFIAAGGIIPGNFHIMFSEWRGMPMNNPYHMPEFRVVFKGETKPNGHYCPGNCDVYVTDINDVLCGHKYIYNRGNGRETAYLHYSDGMEIWELTPGLWKGWKLMHRTIGEKAVH